ncbi:MAG: hypothetical protein ACT4QG_13445 [Sporichthyaceae bacterium]
MFDGRWADFNRYAAQAVHLGEMMGNHDAQAVHVADGGMALLLQGRLDEAGTGMRAGFHRLAFPKAVVNVFLGWVEAEAGRQAEARALLAELGCPSLDWIPYSYVTSFELAACAEVANLVGDRELAAAIYPRLLPLADQFVAGQVSSIGPAAYYLGRAAAATGRLEEAAAHFAHAADLQERTGARGQLVRTYLGWAEVLLARGDAAAARAQRSAAQRLAVELDAPHLAARAAEIGANLA